MKFFWIIFLCLCQQAIAATYYVTKAGDDGTGNGSVGTPWKTFTKAASITAAGDTVMIGDGDYEEYPVETTDGTGVARITYQAINQGMVSVRGFRLSGAYLTFEGIVFSKFAGVGVSWDAAVLIDSDANAPVFNNCQFIDLPYVIANDFTFDNADDSVNTATGDFVAAGFKPGSQVYLGACGLDHPVYGSLTFLNHDTTWTVNTVTANKMTLIDTGDGPFVTDTGTNYWGFIRVGGGNSGSAAISCTVSGGVGPAQGTVTNCLFNNWAAHAFELNGDGWLVEGNTFTNLNSFAFLRWTGSDHIIRANKIKDCPGVLYFTQAELALLVHPVGTGFYDYQVAMIGGFINSLSNNANNIIEDNWFENVENQMGRMDDGSAGAFNVTLKNNVFVGVSEHFSGGRDGMKWLDNTFYKCAWTIAGHPLQIGLSGTQTGYEVSGNIFVACGKTGLTETYTRGWYNIASNVTGEVVQDNFVASEELTGYAPKDPTAFLPSEGTNGGDPVFYNPSDPDGVDNIPYTGDDGLKVLPTSPAAGYGGGALGVRAVVSGQPVAHFRVTAPIGWAEPPSDTFDPVWLAQRPYERTAMQRPYTTPVLIGQSPLAVSFNAEKSYSGVSGSITNAAINSYSWNFGDGSPVVNSLVPTTTHFFTTGGDFTVSLTVRNTLNNTHTYSQVYRMAAPSVAVGIINVPGDFPTIQLAIDAAVAGDTIRVGAGNWNEILNTKRHGNALNYITLDGQGIASTRQLFIRHDYFRIRNFTVTGVTTANSYLINMYDGDFAHIHDCVIDINYANKVYGITWKNSKGPGSSDCIIENNQILHGLNQPHISTGGSRNIIRKNVIRDGYNVDFIRLFGVNNLIQDNFCKNNFAGNATYPASGNHPDFMQTFGNNGEESYGHIIERNWVENIEEGGLAQLNATGMPNIRDWTFRNNVFAHVANTQSCTLTGVKWYNNTFYECNFNNEGHALSFGLRTFRKGDGLWSGYPGWEQTDDDVPSGSIEEGKWYRVTLTPVVPNDSILEGVGYRARTRNSGRLVYNGIEYGNGDPFTGVAGVDDYTIIGNNASDIASVWAYINAYVTYNGNQYTESTTLEQATFRGVAGVTTYTRPSADIAVNNVVMDMAHGCVVKNNVFLNCGEVGNYQNGWYAFDTLLTGIEADYNYVAKHGFTAPRIDLLQRDIGGVTPWDSTMWWEDHGTAGGDPLMNDYSVYDFRQLLGSPLIDTGTNISGVTSDYIRTVRPLGVRSDKGAYEYDDGNPPPPPEDPDENLPPSSPTALRSTSITSSSVALAYDDNSTDETFFELERSLNGTVWTNNLSIGQNIQSYNVTGLASGTSYYFRVRAANSNGYSGWSNILNVSTSVVVPPPAGPNPPTTFAGDSTGPTAIVLTWADTSSNEDYFEIRQSTDGIAWVNVVQVLPNVVTANVGGLVPATIYYFQIRAVNVNGFSAWTDNLIVTTDSPVSQTTGVPNSPSLLLTE